MSCSTLSGALSRPPRAVVTIRVGTQSPVTAGHGRRDDSGMGVLLGWLAVVTGLVGAGLHAANEAEGRTNEPSFWLMGLAASLAYGLAALLLRGADARRIQLLLGGIGLAQGLALLASEWGLLDEQIPLRTWAVWLGSWLWVPVYTRPTRRRAEPTSRRSG